MGFETLCIELDPNVKVYFTGQEVCGYVKAVAATQELYRDITLEMVGKAHVEWSDVHNKRTHIYIGDQSFANNSTVLWNGRASRDVFRPGNYTFPFSFPLPSDIPSSFESVFGRVYYKLKVTVTAGSAWGSNQVEKIYFNVHNIFDLNKIERAMRPLELQREGRAGSILCKQGPVGFEMSAERRGYVPGETIYISGSVWNHNSSPVRYTEAKIIQKLNLRAVMKTKEDLTTVARVYHAGIRPGGGDVWNNVPLKVPPLSSSILQHCRIIDIHYELKFLVKTGLSGGVSASTELIIGSVPLRGTEAANIPPNNGVMDREPLLPDERPPSSSSSISPLNFNDDPPRYSEISIEMRDQ